MASDEHKSQELILKTDKQHCCHWRATAVDLYSLGFANQLLFFLLICSNAIRHFDSGVCRRLIVCFVNSR